MNILEKKLIFFDTEQKNLFFFVQKTYIWIFVVKKWFIICIFEISFNSMCLLYICIDCEIIIL